MLEPGSVCTALVLGVSLSVVLLVLRLVGLLIISYWWVFSPLFLALAYLITVVVLILWILSTYLGGEENVY